MGTTNQDASCAWCGASSTCTRVVERFRRSDHGHFACRTCGCSFDEDAEAARGLKITAALVERVADEHEFRELFVETADIADRRGNVYGGFDWDDDQAMQRGVVAPVIEQISTHSDSSGVDRLLDVGCGNGFTSVVLARAFPGAHVTALDPSPAVRRVTDVDGVTAVQGTIETADLGEQRFDAVVILGNLMLHPDPRHTLRLARGLLRPGGLLIFDFKNVRASLRQVVIWLIRHRLGRFVPVPVRQRAFANMRYGLHRDALRHTCLELGLEERDARSKPPRLLDFANKSEHQAGIRGAVWRVLDRIDQRRDERAWVQMTWTAGTHR